MTDASILLIETGRVVGITKCVVTLANYGKNIRVSYWVCETASIQYSSKQGVESDSSILWVKSKQL